MSTQRPIIAPDPRSLGFTKWTVMVERREEGLRWIVHTEAIDPAEACVHACQSVARQHRHLQPDQEFGQSDTEWLHGLDVSACFKGHHVDMKPQGT
jgi:hypothetical protein